MHPKISIIVATYNWVEALKLSLYSLLNQSILPHEIIIADDGSDQKTAELIKEISEKSSIPVIHCWHEDKGFRLAEIRNKAILKATGDYIIQIDGDIICHKSFVKDHLGYISPNYFVCGRRINLSPEDSDASIKNLNLTLSRSTFKKNKLSVKHRSHLLLRLLNSPLNRYINKGVLGCNMAFWKNDALKINGYNADIQGWGREDDEFIIRLLNAGCKKKSIKFGAIAYHLYHKEVQKDNFQKNDQLLQNARSQKITTISNGIYLYR